MTHTSYQGASNHYLSPQRRDPVKRLWEEPLNHHILATTIPLLRLGPEAPLRVLDVGAGTGDGVELLDHVLGTTESTRRPMRYLGLDPDAEMVSTATALYQDRTDVEFVQGDVREPLPTSDVDMYLSAGVPYSHLDKDEFRHALTNVLARAGDHDHRTAVVVDVLGQYSLEWAPNWDSTYWDYNMSFFQGIGSQASAIAAAMSFYSRQSLHELLLEARDASGTDIVDIGYYDRSVMVGRHTSTGAFNPALPRYRDLVNKLYNGDIELALEELLISSPAACASPEVSDFFGSFSALWNSALHHALLREHHTGTTADHRRRLADTLRRLEHGAQQGIGAGHSLIAVAIAAGHAS